jgi:hypothetical protein
MVSDASGRGDPAEYMATVPRWHGMVDANAMDAMEVVGVRFAIVHTRRHVMFAATTPLRRGVGDCCADLSQKKILR